MEATRRQRKSDLTRTRLLDAGLEVMMERGYDGAALGDITERADLGTGTLYLHFRDKRGLYEAIVKREIGRIYKSWQEAEAARPSATAAGRLRRLIQASVATFLSSPRKARLVLVEGPAPETWLPDVVSAELGEIIGGPAKELTVRMVIGAAWSACRWAAAEPRRAGAAFVDSVAEFCAAGSAAVTRGKRGRRG